MKATILAALGAALIALPATAQPVNTCFNMRDFEGWKAPDAHTIFIRVNTDRYYRLDLSGSCSMLAMPNAHLITKSRGTDSVCDALDWDLSVSDSTGWHTGGMRQACIVKKMTPLSGPDVAAIPAKFKP